MRPGTAPAQARSIRDENPGRRDPDRDRKSPILDRKSRILDPNDMRRASIDQIRDRKRMIRAPEDHGRARQRGSCNCHRLLSPSRRRASPTR